MDTTADRFSGFTEIVITAEQIAEVMGKPRQRTLDKITDRIDAVGRDFIAPLAVPGHRLVKRGRTLRPLAQGRSRRLRRSH